MKTQALFTGHCNALPYLEEVPVCPPLDRVPVRAPEAVATGDHHGVGPEGLKMIFYCKHIQKGLLQSMGFQRGTK